jgi:hypothetical protein
VLLFHSLEHNPTTFFAKNKPVFPRFTRFISLSELGFSLNLFLEGKIRFSKRNYLDEKRQIFFFIDTQAASD